MRTRVADSFDEIRAYITNITAAKTPHCPVNSGRLLFDCLRSPTQCPAVCPLRDDWLGPNEES